MDDTDKYVLRQLIAGALDHPSVYMGGPSQQSVRKAIRLVSSLLSHYDIRPLAPSQEDADRVRGWRKSSWDSLERV